MPADAQKPTSAGNMAVIFDAFGIHRPMPPTRRTITMRNMTWLAAIAILLLAGNNAWANDKSACLAGVNAIKAAIAKKPPKETLDRLQKALGSAQQEVFESDWDECLDYIKAAQQPKK
jgi:hypothetical protein